MIVRDSAGYEIVKLRTFENTIGLLVILDVQIKIAVTPKHTHNHSKQGA